jgi:hypothetical protein
MFRGLSNYPPGHPTGNSRSEVRLTCRNGDCPEEGSPEYATEVYERDTGAAYLDPEGIEVCPDCGQDRDIEPS